MINTNITRLLLDLEAHRVGECLLGVEHLDEALRSGRVRLADRATHFLHQLSGGQMQRTAIARALVHEPQVLLADEPTGNLDSASAEQVLALLQKISSQRRTTMVVVTHSEEVARLASRRIRLRDGRILEPTP